MGNRIERVDDLLVKRVDALRLEYKNLFGVKASRLVMYRIFAENAMLDRETLKKIGIQVKNR